MSGSLPRSRRWQSSQYPFGAWQQPHHALIAPACRTNRAGESFEQRLDLVMVGAAIKYAGMHVGLRPAGKPFEEIWHEFRLQVADQPRADLGIDNAGRAAAKVDGSHSHRFIHRHQEISGSKYSALASKGLVKRLTQHDSDVLYGVMLVDIQIAMRFEF